MIIRWLKNRIIGYSIVGAVVLMLGIAILTFLVEILHVSPIIAGACSTITSIEINFLLNRYITWKDRKSNFFSAWAKFHVARIVSVPINQGIYSLLVTMGIHYLLVTLLTTTISTVANYFVNDKFAFNKKKTEEQPIERLNEMELSEYPAVSVVIPVGGNRTQSYDRVKKCVESILKQHYCGFIEILLVIDPANKQIRSLCFNGLDKNRDVRFIEFIRPANLVGRDSNARWKDGWLHARGDILASTGVSVIWNEDIVSTALGIMQKECVKAVDGIVGRDPEDHSFLGLFRENSLVTEFGRYKRDFLLTKENFAENRRLPSLASFFMTRCFFESVQAYLPISTVHGWDDFHTARVITDAGGQIFCSNKLVTYLNHGRTYRLQKQFTSGVSFWRFYLSLPDNVYSKKILRDTLIVSSLLVIGCFSASLLIAVWAMTGLLCDLTVVIMSFALLGVYNIIKAPHSGWKALFFPPLTALQVLIWTSGALYTAINDKFLDDEFIAWLHKTR